MNARLQLVDVFATGALTGNPLAVVSGAEGLSKARMQAFARWINFSETTFLLPPTRPEADYRVRIFTPGGELDFAGHPTLGTCCAWLQAGGQPRDPKEIIQECGVGLVRLRRDADRLAFAAPPLSDAAVEPALLEDIRKALGLKPAQIRASRHLDNGTVWVGLLLDRADEVLALEPDQAALKHLPKVGVIAPHAKDSTADFEVRAFPVSVGIPEDPVTGSLNASLAQWLMREGIAPQRYTVAQGARLGRAGRLHIAREGTETWIGGRSVLLSQGALTLD
jgi:PhzF family phenazine biosynthesis protein